MNFIRDSIEEVLNQTSSELLNKKVGKLVRMTLPGILSENLISKSELEKLQEEDYCKINLDINYPIIKKVNPSISILENRTINHHTKYYSKPVRFINEEYLITSEWYERNLEDYIRWMKRKVKFI